MGLTEARAIAARNIAIARARGQAIPRRPRKLPAVFHPFALEAALFKVLRDAVRALFAEIDALDIERANPRTDSLADTLRRLFEPLLRRWGKRAELMQPQVERLIDRVNDRNYIKVQEQVRAVIGVDVIQHEPWLRDELAAAGREAAKLIKDIGETAIDRVERIVSDGVRQGQSTKTIRALLKDELGIAERRAALIAVDQVGKLNGNLNRMRQQELGVEEYRWATVGDSRVRQAHRGRNGQTYRWDNPPADGHPGMPMRCRCVANPVLSMFDDLLGPTMAAAT